MNIDLAGKRALVTGSTSGIGRATAASLARAGAEVVVIEVPDVDVLVNNAGIGSSPKSGPRRCSAG